ncbi:MAG: hypothetical protein M3347_00265 [Armatimonadota bacterium]|nr:hypothetical protein [Armatimonadota bacterium]
MNSSPLHHNRPSNHHCASPEQAYREQQVLLFWLLSKILRRLARSIIWRELDPGDKRRLNTTLKTLENDVQLIRLITSPQRINVKSSTQAAAEVNEPPGIAADSATAKAASAEERSSTRRRPSPATRTRQPSSPLLPARGLGSSTTPSQADAPANSTETG